MKDDWTKGIDPSWQQSPPGDFSNVLALNVIGGLPAQAATTPFPLLIRSPQADDLHDCIARCIRVGATRIDSCMRRGTSIEVFTAGRACGVSPLASASIASSHVSLALQCPEAASGADLVSFPIPNLISNIKP